MQERTKRSLATIGIGLLFLLWGWCAAEAQDKGTEAQQAHANHAPAPAKPEPPKPEAQVPITIKDTPASEQLIKIAKEFDDLTKSMDTVRQQALSTFDTNRRQLLDALDKAQKELHDKLKDDKKYKSMLDNIDTIQKQLTDYGTHANQEFAAKVGPIQQQLNSDSAMIGGLTPVVRKENNLPDTAVFDPSTQTWKDNAKKP